MFVILKSFRNSGIVGGKFLERRRIIKPDGSYYEAKDFYVGAVIEVYNHRFELHDADDYAFNYMEANPAMFPMSNIDTILLKIKQSLADNNNNIVEVFRRLDKDHNNYISVEDFRKALQYLQLRLAEQVTLNIHISYS